MFPLQNLDAKSTAVKGLAPEIEPMKEAPSRAQCMAQTNRFVSLNLTILICKMGIISLPPAFIRI